MNKILNFILLILAISVLTGCGKKEVEPRFAFVYNKDVVSGDSLIVTHNIHEANSGSAKKYIVIKEKEPYKDETIQTIAPLKEVDLKEQIVKKEDSPVFIPPKITKEDIEIDEKNRQTAKIKELEKAVSELKKSKALPETEIKKVSTMLESRITCIQKKCIIGVEDSDKRAWFVAGVLGVLNSNPKSISLFSEFMKKDVFNELKNQHDRIVENLGDGFKIFATSISNKGNLITLNGEILDKSGKKSSVKIIGEVALIKGIYGYIQDLQILKIIKIEIKN